MTDNIFEYAIAPLAANAITTATIAMGLCLATAVDRGNNEYGKYLFASFPLAMAAIGYAHFALNTSILSTIVGIFAGAVISGNSYYQFAAINAASCLAFNAILQYTAEPEPKYI